MLCQGQKPNLHINFDSTKHDVRERVIKRKISLQNRSIAGVRAWDLMLWLVSTCRKLNVSFWNYIEDQISQKETIPYLGKIVNSL